ncbi:MAG TPA: hypothetical protein VN719_09555 [Gemmatimonadales bacterium]|nr:hypothetical protein [Gemmatimonadales bacterium]
MKRGVANAVSLEISISAIAEPRPDGKQLLLISMRGGSVNYVRDSLLEVRLADELPERICHAVSDLVHSLEYDR